MRPGVSFAEVLDETLRGYQPETTARQAPLRSGSIPPPVPPNPFLFGFDVRAAAFATAPIGVSTHARPDMPQARATGTGPNETGPREGHTHRFMDTPVMDGRAAVRPAVVPPAARRRLTLVQQRSLAAFVDAGAAIGPDFSPEELRSAFRRLARRYHPDRHPFASDDDKARLSRQFGGITSDYEVLITALDAASC